MVVGKELMGVTMVPLRMPFTAEGGSVAMLWTALGCCVVTDGVVSMVLVVVNGVNTVCALFSSLLISCRVLHSFSTGVLNTFQ